MALTIGPVPALFEIEVNANFGPLALEELGDLDELIAELREDDEVLSVVSCGS